MAIGHRWSTIPDRASDKRSEEREGKMELGGTRRGEKPVCTGFAAAPKGEL
jgi:hypothetical protein